MFSSIVIAGSGCETASIWPLSIAAITPDAVPTPMIDTSSGLRPPFDQQVLHQRLVLEPGAVTPTFMPFRSFGDL